MQCELAPSEEYALTFLQAREFLEERRGLYNLGQSDIKRFSQLIYQFEKEMAQPIML